MTTTTTSVRSINNTTLTIKELITIFLHSHISCERLERKAGQIVDKLISNQPKDNLLILLDAIRGGIGKPDYQEHSPIVKRVLNQYITLCEQDGDIAGLTTLNHPQYKLALPMLPPRESQPNLPRTQSKSPKLDEATSRKILSFIKVATSNRQTSSQLIQIMVNCRIDFSVLEKDDELALQEMIRNTTYHEQSTEHIEKIRGLYHNNQFWREFNQEVAAAVREDIENAPEADKAKVIKRCVHDYKYVFRNDDSLRQFASNWLVNLAEKFDDIRPILIPDNDGEIKDDGILFAAIELAKSGRDVDSVLEVCPANSQPVEAALIKWAAIIENSWQSSKTP